MGNRVLVRALGAVFASICLVLVSTAPAWADNAGDVWVDNVGQPAGPGHEMDPHLACQDINLWGNGLADSSGSYSIDGWSPSGSAEQDYASTWSYDQGTGGDQVLDVISVKTLIENAIANGDSPQANQGFHFKLEFSQDPQKHKTFWVNCQVPAIATYAASGTIGGAIHDQATLSGGESPTGSITWDIYSSSDKYCKTSLGTVSEAVDGDGTYTSPDFTPSAPGSYQWVAKYSGDSNNLSASTSCNDPNEESTVSQANPSIATRATSGMVNQPIHDVATLTGGDSPTGTITWNIYSSSDSSCKTSLGSVSEMVSGDGNYTSPDFTPTDAGNYQWVATYSGDSNNSQVATLCNDPNEQSAVQTAPAPGISLIKLERDGSSASYTHGPITGNVGDTIGYQMTVINTGNTSLVITFSDPHCDSGTLSGPSVIGGSFDAGTNTLSSGGELQYTCQHVLSAGDAPQFSNTASVSGQPPAGPPVTGSDTVLTNVNAPPPPPPSTPGISVVKLQREGSTGSFTTGKITAVVGTPIQYEIQVTNTGNTPLTLSLSDPHCDTGTVSAPTEVTGTLSGNILSPGGEAQYTCSHVLTASDASPFTNTATVTGEPPSGPPVSGTASVTANKAAVSPVKVKTKKPIKCGPHKVKKTKRVHGKKVTVCVAKKKPVVISRKPIRPSGFTG